jgi:hypothetical protein
MRGPTGVHRWAAGVLKHADYAADAEWDHAVTIAAGLELPCGKLLIFGEQAPLFGDLPRPR